MENIEIEESFNLHASAGDHVAKRLPFQQLHGDEGAPSASSIS